MNLRRFRALLQRTLTDPRGAGAEVIAMGWPMQGLWIALMLIAVLLSLIASALLHAVELPANELGDMLRASPAYRAPLLFALINWIQAVISVLILNWSARILGGRGNLGDILAVMIWLEIVSVVLSLGLFVIGLIVPVIGAYAVLAMFVWGIWATIGLIDAAGRFDNMFRAAGVCVVAAVTASVVMMLLSALIGSLMGGLVTRGG